MTYKNIDVIKEFCEFGEDTTIKARNLYFEGDTLFSYGRHFPLCIRLKDGFIINSDGRSQTTARHKGHLIRELTDCYTFKEFEKRKQEGDFKDIKLMDTSEMKELLDEHEDLRFITISELNKLRIIKNLN